MGLSVASLPIGNAVTVTVSPPPNFFLWRILRKSTGTFSNQSDPAAVLLSDSNDRFAVDAGADLVNGTTYYYTVFYFSGTIELDDNGNPIISQSGMPVYVTGSGVWTQDEVVSGIPAAAYTDISVDALSIVRDRLAVGLANEVAMGNIKNEEGVIKVLTAPPIFEDTKWPVVTVHLQSESPSERSLGEVIQYGHLDESGQYPDSEGWLSDTQILIIGWTLNPDVRITLRKILRRLVVGNLAVFDRLGLLEIDFSQSDMEELDRYAAPVYQTVGTFKCLAPIAVSAEVGTIEGVDVVITEVDPVLNLTPIGPES